MSKQKRIIGYITDRGGQYCRPCASDIYDLLKAVPRQTIGKTEIAAVYNSTLRADGIEEFYCDECEADILKNY
jgi:hypothetical protein